MIRAVLLGFIQGLTEFLPISSSGHLALFHYLWGDFFSLALDVLAHFGTMIAIVWFFRADIIFLVRGLLGQGSKEVVRSQRQLAFRLLLASLPVGAVVFFGGGEELVLLFLEPKFLAAGFFVTALMLVLGRFCRLPLKRGRFLGIGFFQALAIVPGISRSALTIAGARILGEGKEAAFRFSFLLGLIAIAGAVIYELPSISRFDGWQAREGSVVILASFLSGMLAIRILKRLFLTDKMWLLSFYCFFLGLGILVFL
jgi:undecaprenyl-diphosphatase